MRLRHAAFLAVLLVAGCFAVASAAAVGGAKQTRGGVSPAAAWVKTRDLKGVVQLKGQIPGAVSTRTDHAVGHLSSGKLTLNFAFPLHNMAGLNALIQREATTHHYLSRAQIYARFAPPMAQVNALRSWLVSKGFTISHIAPDRLAIAASAPAATVESALQVKINNYRHAAFKYSAINVKPYQYYANANAPKVPARLGLQSISGLSNIDRFFTNAQVYAAQHPHSRAVRSGGYLGADLRSLYDINGHDATGQTIGFTLWTTPERQAAMTSYANLANNGGTPAITVDPSCTATGNSPTTPSSCASAAVAPNHLMTILEDGNTDSNANFGSNVETSLDIEAAHSIAPGSALKYYATGCASSTEPGTGLANAGCNGSDVGMEDAMEDAASDPTLHSVSNSWGYGGDPEGGASDPFTVATNNILALAAVSGTSFYFSTGDAGTLESGYPADSPYVVAVGGTSVYSSTPSTNNSTIDAYSTSTEWNGSGSWCANIFARPSWQAAPGLAAASCPGRVTPDISADADPNTGVRFVESTNLTGGTSAGQVGGTSLAAPLMNGLQADTANFVQSTSLGSGQQLGFVAPTLYQMGNSGNAQNYYRDVVCGNTADPTSGPIGDASVPGFDPGSGWGEPDWLNFATGYAITLGASEVSVPSSLATNFRWSCARTPSNSTERAINCPSTGTCYAVGNASGGTPWYGQFLPSGAWGAVNTFFKSTDGGKNWFASNGDMFSVACTSSSTCMSVGAAGNERRTTDSGTTWSDVATAAGNNKPLTQLQCPSSSICYAAGDRGNVMKSTDGGQTWSWLSSTDGNPIYGLSCPDTSTCYATDIYGYVYKTSDGGSTWTAETTPVTTPLSDQTAETGGPNPFAGLLGISCSDDNTCTAVGIYASVSGQTPANGNLPFAVVTTNGGTTWTREQLAASGTSYAHSVSCLPSPATTCFAVGRGGQIYTTTDMVSWTVMTSGTTNFLNDVTCLSTTNCVAVGQNGTVDIYNGTTWTPTTGNGGTGTLASVSCTDGNTCTAVGKNGITIATTNGGTTWTQQAGGGTTQTMNGISCASNSTCYAVGNAGTILATTNGGQTWVSQTSGAAGTLNAIACTSSTACAAVGASGGSTTLAAAATATATNIKVASVTGFTVGESIAIDTGPNLETVAITSIGTSGSGGTGINVSPALTLAHASGATVVGQALLRTTANGSTWNAGTTAAPSSNALTGVACSSAAACAAVGTAGTTLTSADGGNTWTASTSGTTNNLSAISCPSTTCYAAGAAGTILTSTDTGSTWSAGTSGTTQSFNGVACSDNTHCMADSSTNGTFVTSDGSTWNQQGNPVSGPLSSLNSTAIALNGAFCTSVRCMVGLGSQGDIMITRTGPSTMAQVSPAPDGNNGWYRTTTPSVTLNATAGDAPIANTYYAIDGGQAQLYNGNPFQVTGDGSHTVWYWSTDTDGNTETENSTTVKVDDTPTTTTLHITPAEQNGWYGMPTITFTGDDGNGSGVDHFSYKIDGKGNFLTYSGPLSGFSTGNHFIQFFSTDVAGNVEATQLFGFKVDAKAPTVQMGRPPAGAVYNAGQKVLAKYSCADQQSGVASCVGDVPVGSKIDTTTPGPNTFTVVGTDMAGNQTTLIHHYTVLYNFVGFQAPVENTSTGDINEAHAGDLLRISFTLGGNFGTNIGSLTSTQVACPGGNPVLIDTAPKGTATGLVFTPGHRYVYGWQTDAGWAGTCREFSLQLNDGSAPHTAEFQFSG